MGDVVLGGTHAPPEIRGGGGRGRWGSWFELVPTSEPYVYTKPSRLPAPQLRRLEGDAVATPLPGFERTQQPSRSQPEPRLG